MLGGGRAAFLGKRIAEVDGFSRASPPLSHLVADEETARLQSKGPVCALEGSREEAAGYISGLKRQVAAI